MIKELVFEREFKATLLTEELFDAFPEWTYEREHDLGVANATDIIIRHKPGIFIIRGPSEILDDEAIDKIVEKHDTSKLSKSEKAKKDKRDKKNSIKLKLKAETSLTNDEIELLLE